MSLNENTKGNDQIVEQLIDRISKLLDGRLSLSGKSEVSILVNGQACSYLYSITKVDLNTIILHENIISKDDDNHTSRNWIFSNLQSWVISSADKNGKAIDKSTIYIELEDSISRLSNLKKEQNKGFHVPIGNFKNGLISLDFARKKMNNLSLLIAAAVLMCGFFTAIIFNSFGFTRISHIVDSLDKSIEVSTEGHKMAISELSGEIRYVQSELMSLQKTVAQEKEAFLFSRQNTASNIRVMASELPYKYHSRKKAYEFIAIRVESAATYGDLIYQVSRLPQNEAQAETLLATDVFNVKTLDSYNLAFSNLVYPVRLDSKINDGKSFMISSSFMEQRVNPIGTGGIRPHYAVDIININNILDITPANKIVRAPELPGSIVSTADGVFREIKYDVVYGWNAEIEHSLNEEILKAHPKAIKWSSFYAHMNKPSGWTEGDEIEKNEKIGNIGEAGRSTGPHLHFEIRIYSDEGKEKSILGQYYKINPLLEVKDKLKD